MSASNRPGDLLLLPMYGFALCLLVANDHWLKPNYPSWVTGKLSDVAGLGLAPALAVSLQELVLRKAFSRQTRQRLLFSWGTASAFVFTAIQLWPPAASLYSQALGGLQSLPRVISATLRGEHLVWALARHTMDFSDLAALPFCFGSALLCFKSTQTELSRPNGRNLEQNCTPSHTY